MSNLPKSPLTELSLDTLGPLPSGHYIMVVMDDYSRYPVVEILTSTTSEAIIQSLDNTISMFGIPNTIRTDNATCFTSNKFQIYAKSIGFHHWKITSFYPQANGEVERFMKSLNKSLRISNIEGNNNWKENLNIFLRNYRATPQQTIK